MCIGNMDVFINSFPRGKTIGRIIIRPTILLRKTICGAGKSDETALTQLTNTAKQQADEKAGRNPWIR